MPTSDRDWCRLVHVRDAVDELKRRYPEIFKQEAAPSPQAEAQHALGTSRRDSGTPTTEGETSMSLTNQPIEVELTEDLIEHVQSTSQKTRERNVQVGRVAAASMLRHKRLDWDQIRSIANEQPDSNEAEALWALLRSDAFEQMDPSDWIETIFDDKRFDLRDGHAEGFFETIADFFDRAQGYAQD